MNAFGLRRQSASGDGAFETERRVRPARPARSFPHARKRLRAALAAAVQNWPRAFWTAPAERQRRRRFRNGAARSTGQTRSVVTTRRKRLRAALAAALQNWPRAFWTAPAERQRRRRFRNGAARSTGQTRSVVTTRRKRLRAALAAAVQNDPDEFIGIYAILSRSSDSPHVGWYNKGE